MKISVYITSYNQRDLLVEAIESVLAQTLRPVQIIIVDDCSSDGSQELIAGYASCYRDLITPIYHRRNQGVAQTRIDALRAVSGDYVTYVDGDDRYLPTKLEKEYRALEDNPWAQIAYSNNFYIRLDGTRFGVWMEDADPPAQGNAFCRTFAREFPKQSLFRMELVEYPAWRSVGFHDHKLRLYEDYDMRIRLSKHLRMIYVNEPLSEYRIHGTGLSARSRAQHLSALAYLYKKNRPLLRDLDPAERKYVRRKFREWIRPVAEKAIRQSIRNGQYPTACMLWCRMLWLRL